MSGSQSASYGSTLTVPSGWVSHSEYDNGSGWTTNYTYCQNNGVSVDW